MKAIEGRKAGTVRRRWAAIFGRVIASANLTTATFLLGVSPVRAQQPVEPLASSPQGIEVLITPYVWTPWTSVAIHPHDPQLPSPSNTIDAGQLVRHLTWVPFMGEAEIRDGRYGVVADYIHAPLKGGINTPGILFGGVTGGSTIDVGTATFLYRAYADPDQYLDAGAGVRAWGFSGDVSLSHGLLPPVSVTRGSSWADGLAAVRYHRELGSGFGATAYGDVGGGGAHVDWQAIATLDYGVRSRVDAHLGFRSLNFERDDRLASFNVHMYGPILSATFHFGPY